MNYIFSNKLKKISLFITVIGIILYLIGIYYNNINVNNFYDYIDDLIKKDPKYFYGENITKSYLILKKNHEEYLHHLNNLLVNKPWISLYISSYFFFGIGTTSLFFVCVQYVSNSGWSIIITRIMEAISSFIPFVSIILFIVILCSINHFNHIFHWMDSDLINENSKKFDLLIKIKSQLWLNTPFFTIRCIIYFICLSLMSYIIRKYSRKLDYSIDKKNSFEKLYYYSVISIIIFSFFSAFYAWDFVMSLDPHWFSSLFMWYGMVSHLVSSLSIIIIICIYLKNNKYLKYFNSNHLHDLTKYLFGFSLLWAYLWFCQFLLQWYSNIPEEVEYFQHRINQYPCYFYMLIINLLLPLIILMSSSIKRNYNVVFIMSILIFLGHYWDFYNQIAPSTIGPFNDFGLTEIGAFLFMLGIFIYIIFNTLSNLDIDPVGNPYFKESKLYEYPF